MLVVLTVFAGVLLVLLMGTRPGPWSRESTAFAQFQSRTYFGGLDGLRAIGVIAVVWVHVSGPHAWAVLNHGHKGVDLFFAVSGFLITSLLLREYSANGGIDIRSFYLRRALRIFPLYYLVLGLYCALVFATGAGTPRGAHFWSNLPAFLTYTSNWFVRLDDIAGGDGVIFYFAWSLATEEQFYLFWPALMMLLFWLSRRFWTAAIAALLLLVLQVLASTGDTNASFSLLVLSSLAPAILFGSMFAVLLHHKDSFQLLWPVLGHRWMPALALLVLLACLQFEADGMLTRFVIAVFVASVALREDSVLHPALMWKPAVFVGSISYGIYLMHMLAANVVRRIVGHATGLDVFIGTLLLVLVMAYLSFRYFERPILRFKDRLRARERAAPLPPVNTAGPG